MKQLLNKKSLIVDSQDPLQFCLRMVNEIQHSQDPSFLENLNLDRVRRFFFVGQGWRLTANGHNVVSANYIQYMSSNDANKIITGRLILNMDHAIGGPWFLRGQQIVVFDQTVHFELEMMGGNVNNFLDFKCPEL